MRQVRQRRRHHQYQGQQQLQHRRRWDREAAFHVGQVTFPSTKERLLLSASSMSVPSVLVLLAFSIVSASPVDAGHSCTAVAAFARTHGRALWVPAGAARKQFDQSRHRSSDSVGISGGAFRGVAPLPSSPAHAKQFAPGRLRPDIVPSSSTFLPLGLVPGGIEDLVYSAQSSASSLVESSGALLRSGGGSSASSASSFSASSLATLYFAGLLTSFSPCSLGLLPLTVSYISAAAGERAGGSVGDGDGGAQSDNSALLPAAAFAAGLASVFVGLGLSVSLLGGVFGKAGSGSVLGTILLVGLSSGVSVTMGLQLLDLVDIPLPSFELPVPGDAADDGPAAANDAALSSALEFDDDGNLVTMAEPTPSTHGSGEGGGGVGDGGSGLWGLLARTFLLGGSSALVASPCATPVLTSILAFVAAERDPVVGATLLLFYTLGYSTPLLAVGATGGQALANASRMASAQDGENDGGLGGAIAGFAGRFATPLTAFILIWYGTTGFLNAVFGDPSLAGLAPVL